MSGGQGDAPDGSAPLGARAFVALQSLLPQLLLSRLVGRIARARAGWIRVPLTRGFVRGFDPEMRDCIEPDPLAYASFNQFFTRALREGTRPQPADQRVLASPVDGTVSACGPIVDGLLLQAKGHAYGLAALLGGDAARAAPLAGGHYATIYLAPYNYHRIHMPWAGTLACARYVPGRLYSVNATTERLVPGLFARNERIVLHFEAEFGPCALVLVGALFVGSMATCWHGDVAPPRRTGPVDLPLPDASAAHLARGAEVGRFNMGSTVILLLPPGVVAAAALPAAGTRLRVGEALARWPAGR